MSETNSVVSVEELPEKSPETVSVLKEILGVNAANTRLEQIDGVLQTQDDAIQSVNNKVDSTTNGLSQQAAALANASSASEGDSLIGHYDPAAPAYLKTISDLINGIPVNVLRAIDKNRWAGIRAGTDTQDTANAFMALMDGAHAARAAIIQVPFGRFVIHRPIQRLAGSNPFRLVGDDWRRSIIERGSDWAPAVGAGSVFNITGVDNHSIENLRILGAATAFPVNANHAVACSNSNNVTYRNLYVEDWKNSGLLIFHYPGTPAPDMAMEGNNIIEDCFLVGNNLSNNGILLVDQYLSHIRRCTVLNLGQSGTPQSGVQFKNRCYRSHISDCTVINARHGVAFGQESVPGIAAEQCTVNNVLVKDCVWGIYMGNTGRSTVNNINIEMSGVGSYPIEMIDCVDNVLSNIKVNGQRVTGGAGAPYAVKFTNACSGNTVDFSQVAIESGTPRLAWFTPTSSNNMVKVGVLKTATAPTYSEQCVLNENTAATSNNTLEIGGYPTQAALTIAAGVITLKSNRVGIIRVNTEGNAAIDDLDTITGPATEGQTIVLKTTANSRDVVIKHGTGNISLTSGADFTLGTINDRIVLMWDSAISLWCELRSSVTPRVTALETTSTSNASLVSALKTKSDAVLSPMENGAVADGVADDTVPLEAALISGRPVDLGDSSRVYRITRPIAVAATKPIIWRSTGAKIVADFATPQNRVLTITGLVGSHNLIERIHIDGRDTAYVGLRIIAAVNARAAIELNRPVVENIKRSGKLYTEGNGIFVTGSYERVDILRPIIRNITMSADAGVSGSAGVNGIAVRAGSGRPDLINIVGPYIDNVSSDDKAYVNDQDGILIWTDRVAGEIIRTTTANISDGFFKNCLGRSIKIQSQSATVTNCKIYRDTGFTAVSILPDIDLQLGGGRISGITAHYDGVSYKPQSLVLLNTPDTDDTYVPSGTVDGVEVTLTNGAVLQQVAFCGSRLRTKVVQRVKNIAVSGLGLSYFVRLVGLTGAHHWFTLDGAEGEVSGAALWATSGGASTGDVVVRDVVNTSGVDVPIVLNQSTLFRPSLSTSGCFGFTVAKNTTAGTTTGQVQRVSSIAPVGSSPSGVLRPVAFTLAVGETFTFPESFLSGVIGTLFISTSDRLGQGMFSCDATGLTALAAGTNFTVGGTTEPETGQYRLWADAAGPKISNRSAAARTFTCLMFG